MRRTDTLKPHPSLLKHTDGQPTNGSWSSRKYGEALFEQPLLITQENLIVDGYARWRIARHQHRDTLLCQVCQLTEQEALQRILQNHCRPEWLNAFSRVQLALELEPWFREKARANQSAGGKDKLSSKLTEDRRHRLPETDRHTCGRMHWQRDKGEANTRFGGGAATDRGTSLRRNQHSPCMDVAQALNQGPGIRLGMPKIQEAQRRATSQVAVEKHPQNRSGSRLCSSPRPRLKGAEEHSSDGSYWKLFDEFITVIEREFSTGRSHADEHQTDHQEDTRRQSEPMGQCTNDQRSERTSRKCSIAGRLRWGLRYTHPITESGSPSLIPASPGLVRAAGSEQRSPGSGKLQPCSRTSHLQESDSQCRCFLAYLSAE